MFFEPSPPNFCLHRHPSSSSSSPNQNTRTASADPTLEATRLRNLLDSQQHLCVASSPLSTLRSTSLQSNSSPTNLSTSLPSPNTTIQQPQIDSAFFNHLKDNLKVIRDILMGDEEFCMKTLSTNITLDASSCNLFKDSLDGVLKYLNNSFFQNRSNSTAIEHLNSLVDVKSTLKDNPCSTTSQDHIFQNNFFLFYKFCVRALFIQSIIENPELYSKSGDELRNRLSIDDLAVAIDFFENRDFYHSNSPNANSNFNLFGLCHQIPTPNNPPQLINSDEPTQKRKLSQFLSDNEEYSPLLESVDCEESKIKRRKYNIAVLSSFNIDKTTTEIRDLFHPCLRSFYDQVNEGLKAYREEMLSEKNQSKTSMDDAILGTELVCKYRAKESYFHFLESVKKNPYNYHAYFQLLEVFRLMDKNIETMKWLRIGIVRCDEELNYLNTLYEIANSPLMNMKSSPSGIELLSTFTTLIKKTKAVREVFFGCLHHFTHNPSPNEHFFSAIEKDSQCFYGHYFIGMLTGFNKLSSRNQMAPIHFLDNSLNAIKESHAFGFRGIIPAAAYFDSCDVEMTYGNSMLQPFVYYMIGLLKWRVNDVKATMQNFNKALECNENLILIYLNRVTLFQQTKYFDKALKDNNVLMNIIWKHSPLSEIRSELSMAYLNQALLLLDMKEKNINLVVESLEKSFETYPMNICALDWLCGIQTNRQSLSLEKYEKYAEQVYEYMERLERDEMIRFCKLQAHMYRLFSSDKLAKWQKMLNNFGNINSRTH
ncbi:TPR repeat domain protein [Naegleria gruberi]|uniref:TPR repeat domain protein n=1 Tax=Naegleria gruberi TaxID=5762 RepID=D2V122_NAEGR|nr:TPR repeat domain protein [Naegleria gruberi]EFC49613.1 TPR repeat domain protein [Naegleria gruberi]|eukprot:XP_002682357.1 TPR repeat domain protein [Naegleria gruberi strain NEG-M]